MFYYNAVSVIIALNKLLWVCQQYNFIIVPSIIIMSDSKSNSSYALSAIQFNSKSLNPLDSIQPATINKIKREADNYYNCAQRCSKIWEALAKNDMAGSHLTEKVLQIVFKEFENDLYQFTKIQSLKKFMKTFDQDRDGALNQDQQIQIFLFIKERLQLVANNCLQIQQYIRFQNLMKQVRLLEGLIAKWQQILRSKMHLNQVKQYRKEGQNRVDQFCDKYDQEFENLQKIMIQRRQNFERQAFYESQMLEEKLGQSSQYIKIKPTNKIKQLQVQQKLVSLEQRVYEALDFRRQLNELEVKQKLRVDKLMNQHAEQQRKNIRLKHQKQRRELEIKLQQLQNKLMIKMTKQFQILRKKNNLHQIQIRRLQGLEKKWASKKAVFEPQLKRTKKLQKQRNQVLEQYKKSMFGQSKLDGLAEQDNAGITTKTNKFNAQSILNSTVKFKLTSRSEAEIPVNSKIIKASNGISASKIERLITPSSAEKSYSLVKLYDDNLKTKQIPPVLSQNIVEQQKNRKFNFVMSKLYQH